jgi:hypothetical protein
MNRRYVLIGLAALAALAIASPAVGGPSLKSLVQQEVAKQLAASKSAKAKEAAAQGRRGRRGRRGRPGAPGAAGAQGAAGSAANLTVEPCHLVGTAGEPAFQNGWVNFAGSLPACFYKDPLGLVHLEGTVNSGANNMPIFTLPAGYRPAATATFTAAGAAQVAVASTGTVTPFTAPGVTSIDGITFRGTN